MEKKPRRISEMEEVKGLLWNLSKVKTTDLGKLGLGFGIGVGCGVGVDIRVFGGLFFLRFL
jgi:hypothetical protein